MWGVHHVPAILSGPEGPAGVVLILALIALNVVVIAGVMKALIKAGQPGWAILIPLYNVIVFLRVAGRPLTWLIFLCLPGVNVVVHVIVSVDIARRFGKDVGFGLGLAFLGFVFYPILGFGDAKYTRFGGRPGRSPRRRLRRD